MTGETNGHVEKSTTTIPKVKFTKLFINGEFVDSISGAPNFFSIPYMSLNIWKDHAKIIYISISSSTQNDILFSQDSTNLDLYILHDSRSYISQFLFRIRFYIPNGFSIHIHFQNYCMLDKLYVRSHCNLIFKFW